ncbi:MAG: sulfurtransferase [Proteobacteria bacterium]|nr:MAG: sulfurtransferase [Pseudomonadota bacterium]
MLLGALCVAQQTLADSVIKITPQLDFIEVQHDGRNVRIERNQDPENRLTNSFSKTSRVCPPFCIQPAHLLEKVTTIAELEVLDFLDHQVKVGKGLLVDARIPEWREKGTIPGSVSMPFTHLSKGLDGEHAAKIIQLLGITKQSGRWDFSQARDLVLFCNGPWCAQSTHAIKALVKLGYPQKKLFWYRGGMQAWQQVGLTIVKP